MSVVVAVLVEVLSDNVVKVLSEDVDIVPDAFVEAMRK
jgi:uncharacterized protein with FMN-binding domain